MIQALRASWREWPSMRNRVEHAFRRALPRNTDRLQPLR